MNLVDHLQEHARTIGDRAALVDRVRGKDREVSFRELAKQVDEASVSLEKMGFGAGDRILVFHPVAVELYAFLLGCFQVGVVAVLADPSGGRDFLAGVCRRAGLKGFFGSRKAHLLRWTNPELRRIPMAMHSDGWWPCSRAVWHGGGSKDLSVRHEGEHCHPALITFTSGSTGEPKGVMRSHGFLLDQHRALEAAMELKAGECDLVTLPVFALANLASGVSSVIADGDLGRPGEVEGGRITEQCRRWKVTRATAAPAFFEALMRSGSLPDFEKVFTGGAPVFHDLIDRIKQIRPRMEVTAVYGSTEAEPVAEFPASGWNDEVLGVIRAGGGLPAGRPVCEVAVLEDRFGERIDGGDFDLLRLESGERGEIVVSGPQVLTGYLDGRGDEETKIRVGETVWHRTGDAGWLDDSGCLWLVGRCQAGISSDGEVLYPLAIEAALRLDFPGRKLAALDRDGLVMLVIEGEIPGSFEAEAAALGAARVISIAKLPMDRRHQSKIDYPALRKAIESKV
jgi:acyl-CoA synthetase (AMP-forming)/AMP-acid ligase II